MGSECAGGGGVILNLPAIINSIQLLIEYPISNFYPCILLIISISLPLIVGVILCDVMILNFLLLI